MKTLYRIGLILCLSLYLSSSIVMAQDRSALEQACKSVPCREAVVISLKIDASHRAEFDLPRAPFVADGMINVVNGEHFGVEFVEQDGRLTDPHYVKEPVHAERIVTFDLSQVEDRTLLIVTNPFAKTIVYDCLIQHYTQPRFTETGVLPVRGKSVESWPYPIIQVMISNVRFQSAAPENRISANDTPPDRGAVVNVVPEPKGAPKRGEVADLVIVLKALFTRDGRVEDVTFLEARSAPPASKDTLESLTKEAIKAAKEIKFNPAIKHGQAVSQYMQLEYTFKLCGADHQLCPADN